MKEKKSVTIVTHNGQFHTDDVFAVATLFLILEDTHTLSVVRTRDQNIIETADYVVDVGGTYDPEKNRFDHHQEGRAGSRDNGIPYASIGLVWKQYGDILTKDPAITHIIDDKLIAPIDAGDNGIDLTVKNTGISEYSLHDFISAYNVTWKEDVKELDTRFMILVKWAQNLLTREIKILKDKKEAQAVLIDLSSKISDKRLIILDKHYPIDIVVSSIPDTLLVVFPDGFSNNWCIKCVPKKDQIFVPIISMPEQWAGKTGENLEKVTGISGAVFCHINRFFAVAQTKEAAIELAHKILQSNGLSENQ